MTHNVLLRSDRILEVDLSKGRDGDLKVVSFAKNTKRPVSVCDILESVVFQIGEVNFSRKNRLERCTIRRFNNDRLDVSSGDFNMELLD